MNGWHKQAGFTLVELLVAMALLGVILQAIFSLQASTMQASVRLTGDAERLQAMQNVNDYFTGRLRSASDFNASVTVDGGTCNLDDGTRPCFAVKATEVLDPTSVPMKTATYFMTYQLVPRSEIRSADAAAAVTNPLAQDLRFDQWASTAANQIYVLVEKRWRLAAGQETKALPASWLSSDAMFVTGSPTSSVIADDLAPVETKMTPNVTKFVTYDAANKRFDVFLRMKQQQSGRVMSTPADQTFMTSTLYRRN